jgi:uncharacterized protein YndB with AHSA1/START domain
VGERGYRPAPICGNEIYGDRSELDQMVGPCDSKATTGTPIVSPTKEDTMADHVATAEIQIAASRERVWSALTDPEQIKEYMFGSQVVTDWEQGSPIVWKGEYEGKNYEDKGEIVEVKPARRLKLTHFSPLSGQADVPANYHTLVYELEEQGDTTRLSVSQDNNASEEEAEHSKGTWTTMLTGLKEVVERG